MGQGEGERRIRRDDTALNDGPTSRVAVLDALRGMASLAVCWYHFVFANHAFAGGGLVATLLRESARNAWAGVEVFFVLSGFVIPLALFRSRYTVGSYGTFVLKRIARLDPPYLVSVVLCVVLWYLWAAVPHLHGPAFTLTPEPLLLHLGYLNAFFHEGWLNPVYWTLAIELQYYLTIGLLFVLLVRTRRTPRYIAFGILAILAFVVPSPSLVCHYLFVFMCGMVTFQRFIGLLRQREFLLLLGVMTVGCFLTLGPLVAAVSLCTALAVAFIRYDVPILHWLGTISYSLYLVHVPVGGRILGLGLAHVSTGVGRVGLLAVSLGCTIAVATALYRYVERPAQHWSSSIRYGRRAIPVHPAAGDAAAVATKG